MFKTFDGTYYKHQNGKDSVALIAGISANHAFIQVITNNNSHCFRYPKQSLTSYKRGEVVTIGNNVFSNKGVKINVGAENLSVRGKIKYSGLTPIKYDIMGPFKYFPMQCRHRIVSLRHRLDGVLTVDGRRVDFTGGTGYIEGDSGRSFPKNYVWAQCGDFAERICVAVSVADVPFAGTRFRGCVCVVYFRGKEYRLATYLGVKIIVCRKNLIVLKQGNLTLIMDINPESGHKLLAPRNGKMNREIHECIACGARFRLIESGKLLFDLSSENTSFEYVDCG